MRPGCQPDNYLWRTAWPLRAAKIHWDKPLEWSKGTSKLALQQM